MLYRSITTAYRSITVAFASYMELSLPSRDKVMQQNVHLIYRRWLSRHRVIDGIFPSITLLSVYQVRST
jgi:hypothetical protein